LKSKIKKLKIFKNKEIPHHHYWALRIILNTGFYLEWNQASTKKLMWKQNQIFPP